MNCSLLAQGWKWSCLWNCAERILDIKAFLKHAKEIAKKYWWFKRLMTEEEINRWMTELTELNKNIGHVFDNSQGQTDKHGQKAALMSDFRKSNKTEVHVDEKFGWNWGTHLSGVGGWREAEGGPGGPLGSSLGTGGDSEGLRRGPRPPGMASSTTRDPPTNLHTLHTCTSRLHQMELHTMRSSRTSTSRLYASLHNLQMESFQNSERGFNFQFAFWILDFGQRHKIKLMAATDYWELTKFRWNVKNIKKEIGATK